MAYTFLCVSSVIYAREKGKILFAANTTIVNSAEYISVMYVIRRGSAYLAKMAEFVYVDK